VAHSFPEPFQRFTLRANYETVKTVTQILTDKFTRLKPGENEMKKVAVNHVKGVALSS